MTPEIRKQLEEMANKSTFVIDGESYGHVVCCPKLFMAGAQAAWHLATKMQKSTPQSVPCIYCNNLSWSFDPCCQDGPHSRKVEPSADVEQAAKEYGKGRWPDTGHYKNHRQISQEDFLAGDAHGYARARAELSPKNLISKTHADTLVAEAVRAERERIFKEMTEYNMPEVYVGRLEYILSPSEKEGV